MDRKITKSELIISIVLISLLLVLGIILSNCINLRPEEEDFLEYEVFDSEETISDGNPLPINTSIIIVKHTADGVLLWEEGNYEILLYRDEDEKNVSNYLELKVHKIDKQYFGDKIVRPGNYSQKGSKIYCSLISNINNITFSSGENVIVILRVAGFSHRYDGIRIY